MASFPLNNLLLTEKCCTRSAGYLMQRRSRITTPIRNSPLNSSENIAQRREEKLSKSAASTWISSFTFGFGYAWLGLKRNREVFLTSRALGLPRNDFITHYT
jgi:hypothetical protein